MTSISVIIVTTGSLNRLEHLRNLLSSLSLQSCKDFELIIAAESQSKKLTEIFRKFFCLCDKHRVLITGEWNKCRTANAAIRASFGEVVVLLEDDLTLEERWVEKVIEVFNEVPQAGCIYPHCIWIYREGLSSRHGVIPSVIKIISRLSIHESLFRKQVRRINDHLTEVPVFTMCVACKREALYKVGLFDELVEEPIQGEDYDLALRIRAAGYTIVANKGAVAHHFTKQVTKKALRASKNPKYIEGVYASEIYFLAKNLSQVGIYLIPHIVYRFVESFTWTIRSRKIAVPMYCVKGLLKGFTKGLERRHIVEMQ